MCMRSPPRWAQLVCRRKGGRQGEPAGHVSSWDRDMSPGPEAGAHLGATSTSLVNACSRRMKWHRSLSSSLFFPLTFFCCVCLKNRNNLSICGDNYMGNLTESRFLFLKRVWISDLRSSKAWGKQQSWILEECELFIYQLTGSQTGNPGWYYLAKATWMYPTSVRLTLARGKLWMKRLAVQLPQCRVFVGKTDR